MRTSISIAASATVAAAVTHGLVFSAVNLNDPLPVSTYQAFFQQILLATEWLWSHAHGWEPLSHIRDFGRFYAPMIQLLCPLIGFVLFCVISRQRVGAYLWKPLAIALLLLVPPSFSDLVGPYAIPWTEAARTILIVCLMVWSVGALRISRPQTSAAA